MGPWLFLGSLSGVFLPTGEFVAVGALLPSRDNRKKGDPDSPLLPYSWLFLPLFWPGGCQLLGRIQVGLAGGVGW